jgi:hypothetical protein
MELHDQIRAASRGGSDSGGAGLPQPGASDSIGGRTNGPYTDEASLDPWLGYQRLRDAGPAVWLPQYEMFALTRYASVRGRWRTGSPSRRATG